MRNVYYIPEEKHNDLLKKHKHEKNGNNYYVSGWVASTFKLFFPNNSISLMNLFQTPENTFKRHKNFILLVME